ncbi:TKL protein kinase [Salpingoeca rosetta]|uniref:TKL protein kinase n=1 Tax=Salpingoeca rosetta (strain ATCC 50818 / BSB-021) TaxID=946362 RepID=F2UDF2_SALR5|nr:TKL protein kinase [Salpingoeca rosetta]EGD74647.1 TKL protein kinase [Salpingoeca rosetta]|eukprot:XP_004992904.1 TKL protein kinase [Salpingoeca rosetta]
MRRHLHACPLVLLIFVLFVLALIGSGELLAGKVESIRAQRQHTLNGASHSKTRNTTASSHTLASRCRQAQAEVARLHQLLHTLQELETRPRTQEPTEQERGQMNNTLDMDFVTTHRETNTTSKGHTQHTTRIPTPSFDDDTTLKRLGFPALDDILAAACPDLFASSSANDSGNDGSDSGLRSRQRARTSTPRSDSVNDSSRVTFASTHAHKSETPMSSGLPRVSRPRRDSENTLGTDDIVIDEVPCRLSTLITEGTCPRPVHTLPPGSPLSLLVDVNMFVNMTNATRASAAAGLLQLSLTVRPRTFTVHGANFTLGTLSWVLENANWESVSTINVRGVVTNHLHLSIFNPLSNVTTIAFANSTIVHLSQRGPNGNTHPPLARAAQLTHLFLNHSHIEIVHQGTFAGMQSLEVLSFHSNQLTHVDSSLFGHLPSIRFLDLAFNSITTIASRSFSALTTLAFLALQGNDVEQLPDDMFVGLSRLQQLNIGGLPLTELHPQLLAPLRQLRSIRMRFLQVTALPATLFSNNRLLETVNMERGRVHTVPANTFAGLNNLDFLELSQNNIPFLDAAWFGAGAPNLTRLWLVQNELTDISPNLPALLPRLESLGLQQNMLNSIPAQVLRDHDSLRIIDISNNRLRSLPAGSFERLPLLKHISLASNRLTTLPSFPLLPNLQSIRLNDNRLRELPDLLQFPALRELYFNNHRVSHLNLNAVVDLTELWRLEVAAHPDMPPATIKVAPTVGNKLATPLRVLDVRNVDVREVTPLFFDNVRVHLGAFYAGWPGMDEATVRMEDICRFLKPLDTTLQLTNTGYKHLNLCPDHVFDVLLLQNNPKLESLRVASPVSQFNVSGCTNLHELALPTADILDISGTRVPPVRSLCSQWGSEVVVARNWKSDALIASRERVRSMLERCFVYSNVLLLDLSDNSWLDKPGLVEDATLDLTVLSSDEVLTRQFVALDNRANIPIVELTGTPISCQLELTHLKTRLTSNLLQQEYRLAYYHACDCARGYARSGGRCKPVTRDITAAVLGTLAGVFAFQGLLFAVYWTYKRQRRLQTDNALKEQLLVERDAEVMALKKVWEIEYDELRMIKRVAAGACGVVFKAQWDTVTVAVKVLQQGVMMFDESTVVEFEKEVEFLQRTRHPHVVRFFGAGTDPNGSPFLVLEFVAMRSLKDLLRRDLEDVLVKEKNNCGEDNADQGVTASDVSEELTLVSTAACGLPGSSIWDLRVRLLRDVTSGMAFIHSLDQMHRDLKSGNVLVSSSLRAKITDFGSIRQCLTRDRNQQQQQGTRLSSTSSRHDDPQYSPRTGQQTMTSVSLTAGVGTPLYMAPEALTGDKYSFEADVFSFGVLMWEVATQRVPDLIEQELGAEYTGPILATLSGLMADGKRLKFDDGKDLDDAALPEWFKALTYECMAQKPAQRPSFSDLEQKLQL